MIALPLAALWLVAAYALACRLLREASTSVRATAVFVIVSWLLCAGFVVLAAAHQFGRPGAFALAACAALLAVWSGRGRVRRQLDDDISSVRVWWRELPPPARILLGVGLALAIARVCRGLLAPPLAWDGLTYHLVRAGAWVQARGVVSTAAPDAARYYDWFPPYADVPWAWWMVGARSAALLPLAAAAFWAAGGIAGFALARAFGAPRTHASLAAAVCLFTPSASGFIATPYIDNFALALVMGGLLFLARAFESGRVPDAALAAAAFAVAAGVRSSALPVSALGIACAAWSMRQSVQRVAIVVAAGALAAVPYVYAWVATGSPLYPLTVHLGSRTLLSGNAQLDWLLRVRWLPDAQVRAAERLLLERLFVPWTPHEGDYLNLGLGPLLVLPLLPFGLRVAYRVKPPGAVLALLAAIVTIAGVAGPDALAMRVYSPFVLGRFVMVAVAVCAAIGAAWPARVSAGLLGVSAAAGVIAGWPHGWGAVDARAFLVWLPWVGTAIAIALIATRLNARPVAVIAMAVAFLVACGGAVRVSDRFRYDYYEAAARRAVYEPHGLDPRATSAWPLWQSLDRSAPSVLAVSAGWDGIGHNVYRWPLFGSRLQNRVIYVPITRDGSIVDYGPMPPARAALSCGAWLDRLIASAADHLVLLPPLPPEADWARTQPRILVPELRAGPYGAIAYRIERSEAGARPEVCGPE